MTFNYSPLLAKAGDLIQKFGQQYTFTRATQGAFNPATGKTSDTSSTYSKYGVLFNYSDAEVGNGTVEQGDRRLLAEAHDYDIGDTVVVSSKTYRVISVSNIQPAGTNMAVNLQLRR